MNFGKPPVYVPGTRMRITISGWRWPKAVISPVLLRHGRKPHRLDPSGEPIRYHLSALVSYNYGVSLVREGKLNLAMAEWQKALNIQPDLAEAHYALGLGYLSLGNAQQAAVKFSQALSWYSDWPKAHYQLGVAYYELPGI